jgi:hypothetical protein
VEIARKQVAKRDRRKSHRPFAQLPAFDFESVAELKARKELAELDFGLGTRPRVDDDSEREKERGWLSSDWWKW